MPNSLKSYPYPVLGNSEDITTGSFEFTIEPEIDQEEIDIAVNFSLSHPTLESLISNEEAVYSVDVVCKKTLYKQNIQSADNNFVIKISADQLRDTVYVSGYIIATSGIVGYDPEGVHRDLDFGPLDIDAGDILADGGKTKFSADKYFDPLKSPVSSFIKIIVGSAESSTYSVDYDDEIIKIRVPKLQYEDYSYANKHKKGALVHAPIVLPVLVEAIMIMDNRENSWAEKLKMMVEKKGLDPETPFVAAQELLGLPIKRNMHAVRSIISGPSGGEDE